MKLISFFKKLGVFLTVVIWITTLVISFFIGMTYHWASTTEMNINEEIQFEEIEEVSSKSETDKKFDYIVKVSVEDVESIAKEKENGITKQEAENLCRNVLGEKAEENGFPISYRCISAVATNNKLYYVMHITWLVDNNHWSYIGNCYVSSDGQEIYDGIVSSGKYEMTELRWKK